MDNSKVLSAEEVDALLKVAQEKDKENDLVKLTSRHLQADNVAFSRKALANVTELTWSECEKILASFLRKKVLVRTKETNFGKLSEFLEDKAEKHVFTVFHLTPNNYFSLCVITLPLLHHIINCLFGGFVNGQEPVIEAPGKAGVIISEKLSDLVMEGFMLGCKEYGTLTYDVIKTVTLPNLISKLSMEDDICSITYTVTFGESESDFFIMIPMEFFQKFLPSSMLEDVEHNPEEGHSWRHLIQNQVVDSTVSLVAALPEIRIKAKDLVELKEGALIPIGDPTAVEVWLNNLRLFRATAGQANSNRIIKILSEN